MANPKKYFTSNISHRTASLKHFQSRCYKPSHLSPNDLSGKTDRVAGNAGCPTNFEWPATATEYI